MMTCYAIYKIQSGQRFGPGSNKKDPFDIFLNGYTPVGETVGEKFAVGDMDCWRSRCAVGDQSGLLAIFFRSWRSRRTVGDQSGLLAIKIRSWRSRWTVGDSDGLLVRFNIAKSFVNSALE